MCVWQTARIFVVALLKKGIFCRGGKKRARARVWPGDALYRRRDFDDCDTLVLKKKRALLVGKTASRAPDGRLRAICLFVP